MIAFDAASTGTKNVVDTATLTISHTVTGSNGILWVGIAAGSGDRVGTVTYNGVAMTQAVKKIDSAGNNNYVYLNYLVSPATGTHNIVITPSLATALEACAASYTGAAPPG